MNSLLKLNLESLQERRKYLCLKFAKNGTQHDKLKELFPENDKTHGMKTRNPEKYKVQYANTDRLKNSSIIYMQNLLNNHSKD